MTEPTHVGDLLSGYLDAALDRGERERVESHLQACERCRAELQALRALQIDLRAAAPPEPPPGYWDRFAARVEAELPERGRAAPAALAARIAGWFLPSGHLAWTRAIGAVATITIVTFVAIYGFRQGDVGVPMRGAVESSRDAEQPPARPESGTTAPSDLEVQTPEPAPQLHGISGGTPLPSPAPPAAVEPPHIEARAKRELEKSAEPQQKRLLDRDTGKQERSDAPAEKSATAEAFRAAPAPPPRAPSGAEASGESAPRAEPGRPEAETQTVAPQAVAPRALKAGRMMKVYGAEPAAPPAASVESAGVLRFVQAALAGDTGAARAACDAFQQVGAAADADRMRSWLGRVEPVPKGQELRERSQFTMLLNRSADPAVAQLLDLDALVWPRRADASFQGVVADLAGRFEAHAAAGAESRGRAIAYLDWLAAQAPDAASRDLWHDRAEKLRE